MSRVDFNTLLSSISCELATNPDALDSLRIIGVDPNDWPEGQAKSIALRYIQAREEINHEYGSMQVIKDVANLPFERSMLGNLGALKQIYQHELAIYRHYQLGSKLIREPHRGESLLADFTMRQASEIETTELVSESLELYAKAKAKADLGAAHVKIQDFAMLSDIIGGFNPGRVCIAVARSGFGKTTLAQNLALRKAADGNVLFVNMEMIEQDFAEKMLVTLCGTTFREFKEKGADHEPAVLSFAQSYAKCKIWFTHGRPLSLDQIAALARKKKAEHGLDLVIVDYDQKIALQTSREMPEWKALQVAVEGLEEIAKSLSLYIMLLAQEDDQGRVAASKRSIFPASTVLRFFDHGDHSYIQATKSRFGETGAAVKVIYDKERAHIREMESLTAKQMRALADEAPKTTQRFK